MKKYFAVAKIAKRDCSGLTAKAVISSDLRDLAGTVIDQDGIDCPERVSLLSSHDDREVVGYATNFEREGNKTVAKIVVMKLEYASLIRNGALLGISVGLDVVEGTDVPGGMISKSKLLELSLTPIPANQDAQILPETIEPFCLVEEEVKANALADQNRSEAKAKIVRTAASRLERQVKHYRSAVKAKLAKLKRIIG